jgi:hypothetical protein
MGEPGTQYKGDDGSKSQKQLDAEKKYQNILATKMAENESVASNPTGAANVFKLITSGGNPFDEDDLKEAGYDSELKKAWDATQNFGGTDDTYTTSGAYTKAEKSKRKAEKAAAEAKKTPLKADIVEEETAAETTATTQSDVDKAKDVMVAKADTTQAATTATPATTAAAQDKKTGYKSGTIATTPQGLSMEDDKTMRPFRGLLADEKKKKALIG